VQYLKSRPEGQAVKSSLQFLLTALGALKQFSALTESFLIQLDVDLSGTTFGSSMRSMRSKEAVSDSDRNACWQGANTLNRSSPIPLAINTAILLPTSAHQMQMLLQR
jgi:hypothetical protein